MTNLIQRKPFGVSYVIDSRQPYIEVKSEVNFMIEASRRKNKKRIGRPGSWVRRFARHRDTNMAGHWGFLCKILK